MKRIVVMLSLAMALMITGCAKTQTKELEKKVIRFATNGPHIDMFEEAKIQIEENTDYTVEITTFDDVVQPNVAVVEGSADCNFFQHKPYLESYVKEYDADLTPWGGKPVYALEFGIYSEKVKSIGELREGAQIVFGRDPSNKAIALRFLEEQG